MKTKQCFCQSIYNGETKQVENCTCGKCSLAINPVPTQMTNQGAIGTATPSGNYPGEPGHGGGMTSNEEKIATPEQKLYERFPDIAEAIIIQSVDADFGPNDDGTPMKGKALPIGWVVEWLDIVKKQALHSQKERVVEICEEMKRPEIKRRLHTLMEADRNDGYNKALSDLKTKIEEEL